MEMRFMSLVFLLSMRYCSYMRSSREHSSSISFLCACSSSPCSISCCVSATISGTAHSNMTHTQRAVHEEPGEKSKIACKAWDVSLVAVCGPVSTESFSVKKGQEGKSLLPVFHKKNIYIFVLFPWPWYLDNIHCSIHSAPTSFLIFLMTVSV